MSLLFNPWLRKKIVFFRALEASNDNRDKFESLTENCTWNNPGQFCVCFIVQDLICQLHVIAVQEPIL